MKRLSFLVLLFLCLPSFAETPALLSYDHGMLIQDIALLSQLSNIKLTDAQLDQLAKLYPLCDDATVRMLNDVRSRLLRGEAVTMQEYIAGWQAVGKNWPLLTKPTDPAFLVAAVEKILTPEQINILASPFRPFIEFVTGAKGPHVEPILQRLKTLRDNADAPTWAAETELLAEEIALSAGPRDTDAYRHCRSDMVAFIAKVHEMNDVQFAAAQGQLTENLRALVPKYYVPGPGGPITDEQRHTVVSGMFLAPRMPTLLREMKQARAGK